jgi:hypothetical protein
VRKIILGVCCSLTFSTGSVSESISFDVEDDITPDDLAKTCQEEFQGWLDGNVESGYSIESDEIKAPTHADSPELEKCDNCHEVLDRCYCPKNNPELDADSPPTNKGET